MAGGRPKIWKAFDQHRCQRKGHGNLERLIDPRAGEYGENTRSDIGLWHGLLLIRGRSTAGGSLLHHSNGDGGRSQRTEPRDSTALFTAFHCHDVWVPGSPKQLTNSDRGSAHDPRRSGTHPGREPDVLRLETKASNAITVSFLVPNQLASRNRSEGFSIVTSVFGCRIKPKNFGGQCTSEFQCICSKTSLGSMVVAKKGKPINCFLCKTG